MASTKSEKPIHSLILDAGPIIKGEPAVSSMLHQCEQIITSPSVISEIRDQATRSRLQTTLLPFLIQRRPKPESVELIAAFARKTGDYSVLSRTDIELLALTYDLECERNGGDWRLRKTPGQKRTNGPPPSMLELETSAEQSTETESQMETPQENPAGSTNGSQVVAQAEVGGEPPAPAGGVETLAQNDAASSREESNELVTMLTVTSGHDTSLPPPIESSPEVQASTVNGDVAGDAIANEPAETPLPSPLENNKIDEPHLSALSQGIKSDTDPIQLAESTVPTLERSQDGESSDDSDDGGWITHSNLKKKQLEDTDMASTKTLEPKVMQAALITTDFAMQNVLLQMNLNLLSPSLQRVKHIKTFILRCHACFNVVRDLSKQFCPRCGGATLTRVTCTTDQNGVFRLHLKKNMQWNKRGDKYSIPKPVHSSASTRIKGGGKGGWGNELILAEDQKEYVRAITQEKRLKHRDLMDEDYLPGILSGNRMDKTGKPKVGAGRGVNAKKR